MTQPTPAALAPRDLHGVAANLAHKFSISCEHFVWLAQSKGLTRAEVDLLALNTRHPGFDAERNLNLMRACLAFLEREVRRVRGLELVEAALVLELGDASGQLPVPIKVVARLRDSSGREWSAETETDCRPAA